MLNLKFTIIIVCLNPGDKLKKTVESVRKQKYAHYEIIIKDGMSEDGCLDSISLDDRIRIIRMKDESIYDAMNQAIPEIRGDYVLFLNCGDYLYDDRVLPRIARKIQDEGSYHGIYYGDIYDRKRESFVSSPPKITPFVCYRNVPCHQACFYSVEILKNRQYDISYRVRADYEHFLGCIFEDGVIPVDLGLTVASYEGGGYSETPEGRELSEAERLEIIEQYMTPSQISKYRLALTLTMAPLRRAMAESRTFSKIYNGVKSAIYGKGQ